MQVHKFNFEVTKLAKFNPSEDFFMKVIIKQINEEGGIFFTFFMQPDPKECKKVHAGLLSR